MWLLCVDVYFWRIKMKKTLQQKTKIGCLGLALFALLSFSSQLSANTTNSIPFADSFEQYTENDSIIGTNGWIAPTNIYAVVTNMSYSYPNWPLGGEAHTKVVSLNTENSAITNVINKSLQPNIWIDTMVQFQQWSSDTLPTVTNDTEIQAAFFVDTNGHLVIYHTDGETSGWATPSNTFTTLDNPPLASNAWVRLTVKMDHESDGNGVGYFLVQLDGAAALTNALAYANPTNSIIAPGGPWFVCANFAPLNYNAHGISNISFSGTGYIDDFVVTNGQVQFATMWLIRAVAYPINGGAISLGNTTWVTNYADLTITNTPAAHWTNAYLVVSNIVDGVVQYGPAGTYPLTNITNNYNYTAVYAAIMATSNTPQWWLSQYVGASATNDSDALADLDNDGYPNWMEHMTSTDPNNTNSFFKIVDHYRQNGTNYVKWYSYGIDPQLPPFLVRKSAGLTSWQNADGTVWSGTGQVVTNRTYTNIWAEVNPASSNAMFYRLVATNAP